MGSRVPDEPAVSDEDNEQHNIEVSFVIPCLNEEETLGAVINEIDDCFSEYLVYEVVVADNGSTDASCDIAEACGARVVHVNVRGYGAAILGGVKAARGTYCIMGDADGSYPFEDCMPMIEGLRNGADLIVGNRFQGGIAPGAMPWLHRRIGNPLLSWVGRLLSQVPAGDFHCGLRAFRTRRIEQLGLTTPGMEFASEMLVSAQRSGLAIREVPVRLRKDLRSRPPHLRTWRDGWRHLRFLLALSPGWVFLVPASLTALAFVINLVLAVSGPISAGGVELSYRASLVSVALAMVSCAGTWAFVIGRTLVGNPVRRVPFAMEIMAVSSLVACILGVLLVAAQYVLWVKSGFGALPFGRSLLVAVLGCLLIGLGGISFFSSLLYGLVRNMRR